MTLASGGAKMMITARELKDRVIGALNDHDLEATKQCFAPDAVYVGPVGTAEGREQIGWYFEHLLEAFPDLQLTPWCKVPVCDPAVSAVSEYVMTGTHLGPFLLPGGSALKATGRRIAVRAAGMCTIENGLIISDREYYDQLELLSQLGLRVPEVVA
ncbi:ester cyclase [Planotetraspora mira]|uniref:ester cyclase n=1 Tax=Planotetraspora mira TaxID=58121 RepID=UPI00194FD5CF|nr:nuclear transport factor 2 family protein [Planotetraspora mira]